MRTLADNIVIAAALCAAHDIGIENSHDWSCSEPCDLCWSPGCGEPATHARLDLRFPMPPAREGTVLAPCCVQGPEVVGR